ncbi:hypothetical protein GQ53DRAFT_815667 [Thozetella sp. PMI_491]|nr:hypothetical protein GQ53DRAFT_815667 [Thozetella sp. PMI_491]
MSFGFSITDFKEVIALSWRLYTSLKEAPQDLKDLAKDLATVYGVLNHVLDDIKCVTAHGEGRVKMLQTMIAGLKATLNEVQVLVDKFRPLAADQAKPEQLWLKIKWVVGHSKLKRIRQDISLHISSFTLLMTSMGK